MIGLAPVVLAFALVGDPMPIPAEIQAALFAKIFAYDSLLAPNISSLQVLVVRGDKSDEVAEALVVGFKTMRLGAESVSFAEASKAKSNAFVLYIAPGAPVDEVAELCTRRSILCVSGMVALVEQGKTAVGLGVTAEGRPKIIVNRGALKRDHHEMSSQLLGIAKIVD